MSEPVAADQLRSLVDRIERISGEITGLQDDRKEVYSQARAQGFDVKVLRKVIALRKRDLAERQEEATILELYLEALAFDKTPLGMAAE